MKLTESLVPPADNFVIDAFMFLTRMQFVLQPHWRSHQGDAQYAHNIPRNTTYIDWTSETFHTIKLFRGIMTCTHAAPLKADTLLAHKLTTTKTASHEHPNPHRATHNHIHETDLEIQGL